VSRHRYLVAYDIRDDKRLRSIAVCAQAYGTRVQYSVFICDLSDTEKFAMRSDLESRMNQSEDSVMIVDLGSAGDSTRFLFLGHHEKLPSSSAVII
jgi:CRISPR-associated protein Cas2